MTDYKLVPVVPTVEMVFAGVEVYGLEECADADVHSIWEAMLSAVQPYDVESLWMYKGSDGEWKPFMNEQHRLNTIADGSWDVREFFSTPTVQTTDNFNELLDALVEVTASLAWNAHGECRAVHDGPIMPSNAAVELGKSIIAKAKNQV